MLAYWTLFVSFASGAVLSSFRPPEVRQRWLLTLLVLAMALMIGLRFEVGPDWEAYRYKFAFAGRAELAEVLVLVDPGFQLLNWIVQQLGAGIWLVNLVCGLVLAFGLLKMARSQPFPWLLLVVAIPYLVIVIGMSASRQATALGFALIGLANLRSKSFLNVFVWIFIASLFHASAIVLAAIAAVSYSRNRLEAGMILLLSAIPVFYVLSSTFDDYLYRYGEADVDSAGVYYRLAMNIVAAVLFFLFRRRMGMTQPELTLWRNLSLLSVLLVAPLWYIESTTVIDRLSLYAVPLQLVVFSRLPYALQKSGVSAPMVSAAVVAYSGLVLLTYMSLASHAKYYIPYQIYPWG